MNPFSVNNGISVGLFLPLLAGAIMTLLSVIIAGRNATKNVKAQLDIAAQNAATQNDLSAKLKLADFRQTWINNLRDSLSELQARGLGNEYSPAEVLELRRLSQKIRLFMDRKDESYPELSNLMALLISNANLEGRHKIVLELTPLSQKILKDEWEVLKGDLNYKRPIA